MIAHVVELQEVGITVWTLVPLSSVAPNVRFKIIALAEALRALLALIGTLARVGSHVYCQVVGSMEALAACIAQIGFGARMISMRRKTLDRQKCKVCWLRTYRSCTLRSVARGNAFTQ